ncbi:MAG: MFS transporter [Lachnospiraceae bacterium]|nr:MFS transporter [Lachnospiraceae bacterium]
MIDLDNNGSSGNSVVNFGRGWAIIFYCMAMFWFYVGFVNDGSNITAPAVAERIGVQSGTVLTCNSIAGVVGVGLFILVGQINRRIGPRKTSGICMIVAGLCYIIIGNAPNLVVYTIGMCFVAGGIMSAGYIAGGTLVATWFPKKKGIVMGYTTMGHNLASAFYVPLITLLVNHLGINIAVIFPGVAVCVLAVLGFLFIRNTPQERGMYPDNVTEDEFNNDYVNDEEADNNDSGWTTKKLLTNKSLWQVAVCTGFFQICSVGVMSQLVVRNMELGFTQIQATSIMTVLACIGVFGSFIIGMLDDRFGTKRTMIAFGFWYIAALVCNITNTTFGTYISIFMIGMAIGGSANFTTSLPTSVFGRQGFDKVNSVLFPIQGLFTSLCFAVNGIVLNITGSLRYAYIVFACVAGINVILITRVDEHRYNQDYRKEQAIRARTQELIQEITDRVRQELDEELKAEGLIGVGASDTEMKTNEKKASDGET